MFCPFATAMWSISGLVSDQDIAVVLHTTMALSDDVVNSRILVTASMALSEYFYVEMDC